MGKESGAIGIAFPFPRKSLFRDLAQQKKKKTCIASSGVCGVSRLWCNCTHWIVRTLFSLSSAYICMHRQFTEWSHGARQFTLAVAQVFCCGSVCALIFRSLSEEWGAWPNGQSWVFTLWVLLLLFPHKQTTAEQLVSAGHSKQQMNFLFLPCPTNMQLSTNFRCFFFLLTVFPFFQISCLPHCHKN